MKYMLFAWEIHEACGGMNDFIGYFQTVKEAEKCFAKGFIPLYALDVPLSEQEQYRRYYDEGQIVNATSLQVEKEL